MPRVPLISCSLVLAVVACGKDDPVDDKATNTDGLPDVNAAAPSVIGEPHRQTVPERPLPPSTAKIPATLQGRWGLSPADCSSALGDSKGLLVVTPDDLHFYESRAVPAADVEIGVSSISGNFDFTGEGQSWTRYEALKLDNHILRRTEANPSASFSYAKCS